MNRGATRTHGGRGAAVGGFHSIYNLAQTKAAKMGRSVSFRLVRLMNVQNKHNDRERRNFEAILRLLRHKAGVKFKFYCIRPRL